jgi:ferric-chelate reductase
LASAGLPIHVTVYITGPKSSVSHYDAADTVAKCDLTQNGIESKSLLQGSASRYGTIQQADATSEQPVSPENIDYAKLCDIKTARMDTEVVFEKILRTVSSHDRVLVATCGPKSLMNDVRESVDHWRNKSDLAIQMHSEAFDN